MKRLLHLALSPVSALIAFAIAVALSVSCALEDQKREDGTSPAKPNWPLSDETRAAIWRDVAEAIERDRRTDRARNIHALHVGGGSLIPQIVIEELIGGHVLEIGE